MGIPGYPGKMGLPGLDGRPGSAGDSGIPGEDCIYCPGGNQKLSFAIIISSM